MASIDKRVPTDGALLDEIADIALRVRPMPLSRDEAERCRSASNLLFCGHELDREDREWTEALLFRLRALLREKEAT